MHLWLILARAILQKVIAIKKKKKRKKNAYGILVIKYLIDTICTKNLGKHEDNNYGFVQREKSLPFWDIKMFNLEIYWNAFCLCPKTAETSEKEKTRKKYKLVLCVDEN